MANSNKSENWINVKWTNGQMDKSLTEECPWGNV